MDVGAAIPSVVVADAGRIRRILLNLLSNAIKFTQEGSVRLAVELDAQAGDQASVRFAVEDTGIVLGQAVRQALGDKHGIVRYGSMLLPMDETLARVVIDLSNRAYLEHRVPDRVDAIGLFPFQLVEEFMRAFAFNLACNLHTEILYGRDAHHMAEALFKGLARALDQAIRRDPRVIGVPSTKNAL